MQGTTYRCACGEATGVECCWEGPVGDMVVIEWMPVDLRASHAAARNGGRYPHNGATRLVVDRACAAHMLAAEGDPKTWPDGCCWARITDLDPASYLD
jgi:hypothetical protein